jgi:hypothetical protein
MTPNAPNGDANNEAASGFFAPERGERSRMWSGRRVTLPRLVRRLGVCVAALAILDAAIAPSFAPPASYMGAYRLPRTAPTATIADYANAIDLTARVPDGAPIAVFLGASPTYGHRIRTPADTFPAAFASAASSAGVQLHAFNLATNGQVVGDYLVLARRFAPDAAVVFVQLTYHTFAPAKKPLLIRYPELPSVLGVPVSAADSALLGLPARTGSAGMPAVATSVDSLLAPWWTLWRERDVLDRRLFGGPPRQSLAAAAARLTGTATTAAATTTVLPADTGEDRFASFDQLDPAAQMVVVAQYAEESSFTLSPGDPSLRILHELAAELSAAHKKAVFYLSPMNQDVIDSYGLIDPGQYRDNVARMRRAVSGYGFPFIDFNTGERMPPADFADISHTNDRGGLLVGRRLWAATGTYVTGRPR